VPARVVAVGVVEGRRAVEAGIPAVGTRTGIPVAEDMAGTGIVARKDAAHEVDEGEGVGVGACGAVAGEEGVGVSGE